VRLVFCSSGAGSRYRSIAAGAAISIDRLICRPGSSVNASRRRIVADLVDSIEAYLG